MEIKACHCLSHRLELPSSRRNAEEKIWNVLTKEEHEKSKNHELKQQIE